MIRPPSPCSRMRTAAARVQVNVPRRWVVMTASKSSSVIFQSVVSRRMPALLTRMSSRPNSLDRAVDQGLRGLARADRDHLGDGRAAGLGDRGDRGLGDGGIHVVDDHGGARAGQLLA